ncbi:MAG: RNA polymerase sigma factor [Candidatus Komeilibacteria bacterium]
MSRDKLTDKLLILKARLGDKSAFANIYNKYVSRLYRFAYYKTSNKEMAEDLVSQTFLKMWEKILVGGQIRSLQALLYQILRNLIIDYYRSRQRTELPLSYDLQDEGQDATDRIHAHIDRQLIKKALGLMNNDDYREVVILRYIEGLSVSEVAKILDKSNNNITTISHRALQELKKILRGYQ